MPLFDLIAWHMDPVVLSDGPPLGPGDSQAVGIDFLYPSKTETIVSIL